MNTVLQITLNATPEQAQRLLALQQVFAQMCNALAPQVQRTRVWNRVALHHMAYRGLRAQFPGMGSQMACNAILAVSRMARLVYQHPASPFSLARLGDKPLPLLKFAGNCPVYFDRHTLSLKNGQLSMYTLDGRMHFKLALHPQDEAAFHSRRLREVVLTQPAPAVFALSFRFSDGEGDADAVAAAPGATDPMLESAAPQVDGPRIIPAYVLVEETE